MPGVSDSGDVTYELIRNGAHNGWFVKGHILIDDMEIRKTLLNGPLVYGDF